MPVAHKGRPYRRARQQMFAMFGDTCWWCGHPGATGAGHIDPVARNPSQPVIWQALRPVHDVNGHPDGCPTCGRKCNQEQATKTFDQAPIRRPNTRKW